MSLLIFFQNNQTNPVNWHINTASLINGHVIAGDGVNGVININAAGVIGSTIPPETDPAIRFAPPSSVQIAIAYFIRPGVLGSAYKDIQIVERNEYP